MPTAQEVRSWYNRRYASLGLDSMRPFEAYPPVLDLLAPRPGTSVLDVSCGSGFLLQAARQRGLSAFGVDLSDAAVRLAHQVSPDARVAVGTGEELCFRDGSFDYVTCLGSLEHFLDLSRGLREMLRVAKPGAQFCIMVPNRDFAGWKLLGHRGTAQQDINERLLSLREWRQTFEQHGMRVRRVLPDRWHAVKWRSDPHRGRRAPWHVAKAFLLEAAWRLLPLSWEYQFIFLLDRP
jgi:ubiquinone/menaquinone biosynthesis C-methylase UbiE